MRKLNIIAIFLIGFILNGCADEAASPVDAFKGQSEEKIYSEGKQALQKKHYDDALKHFEALDALYPFSTHSEQAQLDTIYAYYQSEDMDSTVASASRYIHLHPNGDYTDYAYYMRGIANFEKNITWVNKFYTRDPSLRDLAGMRESFADFNTIVTQFPSSKYAFDAQNRMIYIRNLVAKQELEVANFYFKKKAYVAAANRASFIVQHLQGTAQVEAALKIMVKSYQALGAIKEADDTLRILKLNYPNTKL